MQTTSKKMADDRFYDLQNIELRKGLSGIKDHQVQTQHVRQGVSDMIKKNYPQSPQAHLIWAHKLCRNGFFREGFSFIRNALDNAEYDAKPFMIFSQAAGIFQEHGGRKEAIQTLQAGIERYPDAPHLHLKRAQLVYDTPETARLYVEKLSSLADRFPQNNMFTGEIDRVRQAGSAGPQPPGLTDPCA